MGNKERLFARILPLTLIILFGCQTTQQDDVLLGWIREQAVPLAAVEAGKGFEDLLPLKTWVWEARIVALGEFSHGTREVYQLKHRFLEFLVSEMGFSVFAFESPWPEGLAINDYVLHGKGDPAELLRRGVFGVFYCQELLDTILWMRQHNLAVPPDRRVRFYGIDLGLTRTAARQVTDYLRKVDPPYAQRLEPMLELLRRKETEQVFVDGEAAETALVNADQVGLVRAFDRKKDEYIELTSEQEWTMLRQHARILEQAAEVRRENSWGLRDHYMAENVFWILKQEGENAKMLLSAHNLHVSYYEHSYGSPLGRNIRQQLGDKIVVFGFAFNKGTFRGVDMRRGIENPGELKEFEVSEAPSGSLDVILAKVGYPVFAVELRNPPISIVDVMRIKRVTREVGGGVQNATRPMWRRKVSLPENYDALIFINETSAVRPIRPRLPR